MYQFKIVTDYTWGSTSDMICIAISYWSQNLWKWFPCLFPHILCIDTYILSLSLSLSLYIYIYIYVYSLRLLLGTQVATTVD